MNQIVGILAGLGAMVSWGLGDFLAAKASREKSPLQTLFLSQLLGLLILAPIFLLIVGKPAVGIGTLALTAVLSLIFILGTLSFYKALEIGPISITSPISSAYPLVVVLISVAILREVLSLGQWVAIGLIMLGIFLASVHLERPAVKINRKWGIIFALLAATLWGVSIPFIGKIIDEIGWFPVTFLGYIFASAWLLLIFGWRGRTLLWGTGPDKNIVALTLLMISGASSFYFGLERALTAIVTPVSSTYPLITVLLAVTFLKESVAKNHLAGAALIISGLVLLAASS